MGHVGPISIWPLRRRRRGITRWGGHKRGVALWAGVVRRRCGKTVGTGVVVTGTFFVAERWASTVLVLVGGVCGLRAAQISENRRTQIAGTQWDTVQHAAKLDEKHMKARRRGTYLSCG